MRVYGQLMICRFVEECLLRNLQVISVNTDSCDTFIPRNRIEELNEVSSLIEKEFNVVFEDEFFKSIYFKNVNNYLAITDKDPKVKGSTFITNPLIGNSNDFLVIPKMLVKYFTEGVKPESILNNKEWSKHFHIYDFCASYKIAKKYSVLYNGKKQQQLNRFFVSKKGYYLYKQKKGKNMENVLKGWGVELLNRYDNSRKTYEIDFRFYLTKINEVITELEPNQIDMFST